MAVVLEGSLIFQHDNDHCLAKEAEGKGDGLAKHVSRPKPYWASVGRKVSNIHQLRDIVMVEWKRTQWQPVDLW